jgi:hypothetical protein
VGDHGSHARHDRFAIVDAIGGGAIPSTIGTCPACSALHIDLMTLQLAVRAAWTPRRERDLRLTVAGAARLQRGRVRRLLETIGTPRDALTRPLALSFTGLGLAGLLLMAVPTGMSIDANGAAAPVELDRTMVAAEPAAPIAGAVATLDEPASTDPLPGLSIGLLTIGAALFVVRRAAHTGNGVR